MTNGKFKVGDSVILSKKGKKEYADAYDNPHNTLGKTIEPLGFPEFTYRVVWPNGKTNSYRDGELKKIKV